MICSKKYGRKSKLFLVILELLLLLSPLSLSGEEYTEPVLPPGWYPMHETELTELDQLMSKQWRIIELQEIELSQAEKELHQAENLIKNQATSINELDTYLTEYESEVQAKLWTTSGISFTVGVGVGILAYLILQ